MEIKSSLNNIRSSGMSMLFGMRTPPVIKREWGLLINNISATNNGNNIEVAEIRVNTCENIFQRKI